MISLLAKKVVRFWLSPAGKQALAGIFEKDAFQAYVHSVDELGAWIVLSTKGKQGLTAGRSMVLLKWDYFSTAHLDFEPESTPDSAKRVH